MRGTATLELRGMVATAAARETLERNRMHPHRLVVATDRPRRLRPLVGLGRTISIVLVALLSLAAIGPRALSQSAAAQATPTATTAPKTASAAPQDADLYISLPVDTSSAQWKDAEELVRRITGNGIGDAVSRATTSAVGTSGSFDLTKPPFAGGEIGLVVTSLDAATSQAESVTGSIGIGVGAAPALEATPEATGSNVQGGALIIASTDVRAAEKAVADELASAAGTASAVIVSTTYHKIEIQSFPAGADGSAGQAYAVVGDLIALAATPADLEPIIDAASGSTPSLADLDAFTRAASLLPSDRLAYGFLNGNATSGDLGSFDSMGLPIGSALSPLLGAERYTAFTIAAGADALRLESVEIPVDGKPNATAKGDAASLTLADQVPANTVLMVNGFDIGKGALLQGVGAILVSLVSSLSSFGGTPAATPSIDQLYTDAAQLLGFNLQTDFLQQLTGVYDFALWDLDPANPAGIQAVLASDTDSAGAVGGALGALGFLIRAVGQNQATVTTKTIGDGSVSEVSIGGSNGGTPVLIDFGLVNDRLMVGVGNGIQSFVDGTSDPLSGSSAYKDALAQLPADHDGVLFINVADLAPALTALSSSSSTDISTPRAMAASDLSAVQSVGMVSYKKNGYAYTSAVVSVPQ